MRVRSETRAWPQNENCIADCAGRRRPRTFERLVGSFPEADSLPGRPCPLNARGICNLWPTHVVFVGCRRNEGGLRALFAHWNVDSRRGCSGCSHHNAPHAWRHCHAPQGPRSPRQIPSSDHRSGADGAGSCQRGLRVNGAPVPRGSRSAARAQALARSLFEPTTHSR